MSVGGPKIAEAQKIVPDPDGLNADFYVHAATGTLHIQRCESCGQAYHPPRYLCRECGSEALVFVPSKGRGRIFSWTVSHRPVDPAWAADGPGWTLVGWAGATAVAVRDRLSDGDGGTAPAASGDHFFVTDSSERFREVGSRFLGRPIDRLELVNLAE